MTDERSAPTARTILVTGATGTVGSAVVERLRDTDARVRIATRETDAAASELDDSDGWEYVTFDFERPETWGRTLEDVDRLFLVRPPVVGVAWIREFVDAATRVGVEHVVYISVLGAEKNPLLSPSADRTPHRSD